MQGVRADCFFESPVLTAVAGDKARHLTEVGAMRIRRHEIDDCYLYPEIFGAGRCVKSPMSCKVPQERVLLESGDDAWLVSAWTIVEALIGAVSVAVES